MREVEVEAAGRSRTGARAHIFDISWTKVQMMLKRQIHLVIYRLLHLPIMSPEYVLNISNTLKHAYWLRHALPRQCCKIACAP